MKHQKQRPDAWTFLAYAVLILWSVTTVYPFIWVFLNSFKSAGQIQLHSFALPESLAPVNYRTAFERVNIPLAYRNSFIISGTVTVFVVFLAGMGAFALARYRFRGQKALYSLLIAAMMFPVFATIIPVYRMIHAIGLMNSNPGVILPQIAGNLAFAMVILIAYMRSLPQEIEESAFIEGCNAFQIFFRIVAPLSRPAFATVAIFSFIWSYNDLFTQLFILRNKNSYAITRLLYEINSIAGVNYGLMAASVVLVVIPVLLVYFILQKNIIKGLTAGAVKG